MSRIDRAALLLVLAGLPVAVCLAADPGGAASDAVPVAGAEVRVEAEAFAPFTQQQRREVQNVASRELAEKCRTYFPFLRWTPYLDEQAPENESATLTLIVREDPDPPRGYELAPPVWVVYEGRVGSARTKLPNVNARLTSQSWRTLYEFGIVDAHDTAELKGKLSEAIERHFDSDRENFRRSLEEEFLRLIPLVSDVDAERPPAGIVIPIPEREMQARNDTLLRFEFESPFPLDPPGALVPGAMELVKQGGFPADALQRQVYCRIDKIQHAAVQVPPPVDQALVRELVRLARNSHRRVLYMWDYKLDPRPPSTANGLITGLE